MPDTTRIPPDSADYPQNLRSFFQDAPLAAITARGNIDILRSKPLAFFCSVKCPGSLIVKTYDLARELRRAGVAVVSGFQSPMEKECLAILLRGAQPIIICPARGVGQMRIPRAWGTALAENRLLLLSPFPEKVHRPTAATARRRNEFVAAIGDRIFVAHGAIGSKTEAFCHPLISLGKRLVTFDSPENAHLIAFGATAVNPGSPWLDTR